MVYKTLIRTKLEYGSQVYGSASDTALERLDVYQNKCLRVCLGALKCTRIARMEVEVNIPPLRLRRDQLAINTTMSTIRKSEIGNVASAYLQQHHYLHHGRGCTPPPADRTKQLQIDLGDCDKFITCMIPPWETPNFGVNTSWLPSSKEKAPELEIHHLFGGIVRSHLGSHHVYTDGSKSDECVGASV
ncbi:hypothetical protein Pmani_005093 [Petrolisthes manimaculis]|uniref:Uncharacterized protein n=1 Tax=Petrolisthes manimaculis TaxID=1843537 RepID=A0AAE1QEI8_9EUCA|nr:hypothetical protein Pmani_005093 [Petrolisthes manimaculis]